MGIMKSPAKVLLSFILLASGLTALPNQLQPRVRSARSKQVTVVAPQNTPASRSTLDPTTSALTSSTTGKIKSIPLPTTDHPDDTLADNRIGVAEEAVAASTNVPKKINNDADRAEIDAGNDDGREDERIEQKNSPIGNAEGPAATAFPPAPRESLGKIRPQLKLTTNYTSASETGVRLPEGASAALAKPTKYHYYPHNQHIYLLPECAVQQVCNAVYVRLNFTQPLCACPGRYRDPCSASLDSDDQHTTELVTDPRTKALTLVKTCEPVADMRECRAPKDWSLLALQNVRTGKSHYLVICRCPDTNILEGPMSHDQPMYASVPGIRVYGMMCVQGNRRGRPLRYPRNVGDELSGTEEADREPGFPWDKVPELLKTAIQG
ncbi:uncharacterized protein LOC105693432 isoform X1 [Athalia rosae]|uniref:uncharacterized protein LOC105693432 isoform X1 n=1 Tax=Athalia rosae TaxID=37344 RepID=UPI002034A5C5|nr:uncharacterized protein LOC105693432 isoform X1 [Athalia rosae]